MKQRGASKRRNKRTLNIGRGQSPVEVLEEPWKRLVSLAKLLPERSFLGLKIGLGSSIVGLEQPVPLWALHELDALVDVGADESEALAANLFGGLDLGVLCGELGDQVLSQALRPLPKGHAVGVSCGEVLTSQVGVDGSIEGLREGLSGDFDVGEDLVAGVEPVYRGMHK